MLFDNLTTDNIMLYCMKAYDRPNMLMSEFKDDMKRFNYLKRLFKRYRKDNDPKELLVLNHLVVLGNVFSPEVATRLLFYKMSKDDYSVLKTYLLFLKLFQLFNNFSVNFFSCTICGFFLCSLITLHCLANSFSNENPNLPPFAIWCPHPLGLKLYDIS